MSAGKRLLAFTFVLAAPALSMASGGGHGEEHGPDRAAWLTLGFAFFNFTLFVLLIRRYAWPAVQEFLLERHRTIVEAMEAAKKARQEAEAIRADFALKEAALEETRQRMLAEIREVAEADRARILLEAEQGARRLTADAERQAASELARARRELRAEAARLAAELAAREVESRLGEADRARLVREFVEGVARP